MKDISTCLWFDHHAEDATRFYSTVFKNFSIAGKAQVTEAVAKHTGLELGSAMAVSFKIENAKILGLNGGPIFKFSPSMSYFVICDTEAEADGYWKKLSDGGQIRMGLDKYPWAQKYGWTADKFGVEWQIIYSAEAPAPTPNKIVPAFLFVDALFGKGEEAMKFYVSVFPNSKINSLSVDPNTKSVMHSAFTLNGQPFSLMEGAGKHGHTFTEAMSIVVNCDSQEEIDHCWNKLIEDGGSPGQCGWLKDKYGVSWQIVPSYFEEVMADPMRGPKATAAMLPMKKLDYKAIKEAAK